MPLTVPANVTGALVINARMVGAIAYLRGYELDDPHMQTVITMVVAGASAQTALGAFGVKLGTEAAKQALKAVPIALLREINKRAGFFLLAKYGTKRAAVTLVKAVPLAGGLVGGAVDASLTKVIGSAARKTFVLA